MIKPLFMWAGGKTRLLKHYIPYLPKTVDSYYEPFFGGGALFLHVMQMYKPQVAIINDINADIMRIYAVIKRNVAQFIDVVDTYEAEYLPLSKSKRKEYYFAVRHAHAYDFESWGNVKEAATLYFLMKTGFNGIYQINKNTNGRFGTPSGLLNQTDTIYDKKNVLAWHHLLQSVVIKAGDWSTIRYQDKENHFIFFDPPYRGSFTSYGQTFSDDDQRTLLDYARSFEKTNIFLANREIGDNFYKNVAPLHKMEIPVTYTAGRRKQTKTGYEAKAATEVLLYTERILDDI
jgi:DNA adenine methylase